MSWVLAELCIVGAGVAALGLMGVVFVLREASRDVAAWLPDDPPQVHGTERGEDRP